MYPIQSSLTINGATQTTYFGKPMIELDGNSILDAGLNIYSEETITVTVIGLAINRSGGPGIFSNCQGTCNITLLGNFIGTDPTGTLDRGNDSGVYIKPTKNSTITIGGAGVFEGNVITGNNEFGVVLVRNLQPDNPDPGSSTASILGNKIGTDFFGNTAIPNGHEGIRALSYEIDNDVKLNLTIGGKTAGARNVISGNVWSGLLLDLPLVTVVGNYIGTNAAGNAAILNQKSGISISAQPGQVYNIGGTISGQSDVISGNVQQGIYVKAEDFFGSGTATLNVRSNKIGTDALGMSAIPNDIGIVLHGVSPGLPEQCNDQHDDRRYPGSRKFDFRQPKARH